MTLTDRALSFDTKTHSAGTSRDTHMTVVVD